MRYLMGFEGPPRGRRLLLGGGPEEAAVDERGASEGRDVPGEAGLRVRQGGADPGAGAPALLRHGSKPLG